jgi:hypothetical protein
MHSHVPSPVTRPAPSSITATTKASSAVAVGASARGMERRSICLGGRWGGRERRVFCVQFLSSGASSAASAIFAATATCGGILVAAAGSRPAHVVATASRPAPARRHRGALHGTSPHL